MNENGIVASSQSLDKVFIAAMSARPNPVPVPRLAQSIQQLDGMITEVEQLSQLRPEWIGRTAVIVRLLRQTKKLMKAQRNAIEESNHILK